MENARQKKPMSNKSFVRIWTIVLAVVLVLALALNIALGIFSSYVDNYLGGGTFTIVNAEGTESWDTQYAKSDYASADETNAAAADMVVELEQEGIVLMKNNGALPLDLSSESKVTLLGRDAADPVYGGSGSGSVDASTAVDAKSGLENAGFEVNGTVYDLLSAYASDSSHPKANIVMDKPDESSYYIGEMPVENYTDEAVASFASYNGAAIVMIGRGGGEGGDLARDMEGWDDNYVKGQHQLELNQDEKDVIELAKANFDKVIVLINASTTMELGILEDDPDVDAIVWIGSPGQTGFTAVGQVLSGEVNPSGKTADLWAADFTKDPSFVNFGSYQYENVTTDTSTCNGYFVQYEEGIYVGYRYYETAAVEGFIDYDQAVVYPFGYGLSYTTFDWAVTNQELGGVDGNITVDVTVTNTGSVAGKDVVELYYSAPYYADRGIEKSSVVLGDFAKTGLLQPGESETVTLTLAVEDMASYDYKTEKAYVLDEGEYTITLQSDSHTVNEGCEPISYTLSSRTVFSGDNHRSSDLAAVTNQFDDVSAMFTDTPTEGYALNMSRSDFAGTFPTAPVGADLVASDEIVTGYNAYDPSQHLDDSLTMPTTGADNGVSLIDLRGKDYDDPLWQDLLDQLTVQDMLTVILTGAYHTEMVQSVSKPNAVDLDGPAGISQFMGGLHGTAYTSEVVIASSWNKGLAYRMGVMVGNEVLSMNVNGWYAPAMNMHRSPFAGRNFEYYSEDPVLSGAMGTAVVSGAQSKGVYCFIKHFALNDQESHRTDAGGAQGVASWANEQAIREIYLKPFEMTVKDGGAEMTYISDENGTLSTKWLPPLAVMSSFNRIGTTWAGGSKALMTNVLRNEWGFVGYAITDFNLYNYMYPDMGVAAGTDLMLTFTPMKSMADTTSATSVTNMRNAMHNILYTVANSNAMNGIAPGAEMVYHMSTWRVVQIAVDVVLGVLYVAAIAWVVVRVKKHKNDPVDAADTAPKA